MKKQIFITIGIGLLLTFSCGSPNKEKSTTTPSEQSVAEAPKTDTNAPAAAPSASAPSTASPGEKLFTEKTCTTCHKPDTKLVGPSLKDIAAAYKDNKDGLKAFLKGEGKAIVDPSQESVMHPQIAITKALSAEQLDQMADYILSHK